MLFRRRPEPQNHLLTGIPRSGTTLACFLLCQAKNYIALNEPLAPRYFQADKNIVQSVGQGFKAFRTSLLEQRTAPARAAQGQITDNAYNQDGSNRKRQLSRTDVQFDKDLTKNFGLTIKHCDPFTLHLRELSDAYRLHAVIRNPLSVLASWRSVNVPASRGLIALCKQIRPELQAEVDRRHALLEKQLFILDWFFAQYERLDPAQIIRYEDITSSNGRALDVITSEAVTTDLRSKNTSKLYARDVMEELGHALLKREGHWLAFYDQNAIQNLLNRALT